MNILITGGAGYIGTELTNVLAEKKEVNKVVVYDNLNRSNYNFFLNDRKLNDKVSFVKGDILDSRKIRKVLKGIDVVYHLAAKVSTPFANEDPHYFEQSNHWGTAELVYAIEESDVKKLIFTSSTSVYGPTQEVIDITYVPKPDTYYGSSKLRAEGHVTRLGSKITANIIRCGNVYGYSPSMRFDAVINRFMFDANYGTRISVHGNGMQSRAFIHIESVTYVLIKLLEQEIPSGTYNMVEDNLSVLELSTILQDIYPDLELLFINQHLGMRDLTISPDSRLGKYFELPKADIKQKLIELKDHFSFSLVNESADA